MVSFLMPLRTSSSTSMLRYLKKVRSACLTSYREQTLEIFSSSSVSNLVSTILNRMISLLSLKEILQILGTSLSRVSKRVWMSHYALTTVMKKKKLIRNKMKARKMTSVKLSNQINSRINNRPN
jgi:ribosomal protein S24E